jgi:cyclic pyranopterin phosphate synthase
MPAQGVKKLRHSDILSMEELAEIVAASARSGITKVRVTGGEPLVRRGILELCRKISETPGILETCLTTNGALLTQFAKPLRDAGVKRLNISLDTLDPAQYRALTRGGELSDALRGIDAARDAGFDNLKINAVLIGGVNDGGARELIELTRQGLHMRFIELMPIGECAAWSRDRFIGNEAVLRAAPELEPETSDGVAKLYRLPGAAGTVGLISPISAHFCPSCNRIRVTSDGRLKPCLHSAEEYNLRGLHGDALENALRAAILQKPQRHHIGERASESLRNMNAIGG